jgi:hypothetical protein
MARFKVGDYKQKFKQEVDALVNNIIEDRNERMRVINDLIEEYIADTGERPDARSLDKLSSLILYEELKGDTRPNKATAEERPILTSSQVKRRQEKEVTGNILNVVRSDGKVFTPKSKRSVQMQREVV